MFFVLAMWISLFWLPSASAVITIWDARDTKIISTTGRYMWPEIQTLQENVASATQWSDILMYIPDDNILAILQSSKQYQDAHTHIRRLFLQSIISRGFSGFLAEPFDNGDGKIALLTNTGFSDFVLLEDIPQKDMLDNLLLNKLVQYRKQILHGVVTHWLYITQQEYDSLSNIYLFKNNEDLYGLWYEVVAYRYRTNNDAAYRRNNINVAFSRIGNVRVINPNETFSFQTTIQDSNEWKFKAGPSIVGGKTVYVYWGWLCGASTALYQWILTNTAIEINERYPHTKRYANLYDSFVNGESINIPGLDSTVFFPDKNMQLTNKRSYPVIVILNYDGSVWWTEEVFSLSKIADKGSLAYKWLNKKCYVREINGTDVSSCYQQIF